MILNRLSTVCVCAAMTLVAPASYGNDIVDFLRALRGHDHHHHDIHPGGHHIHRAGHRRWRSHDRLPHRSVSIHVGRVYPHSIYPPAPVLPWAPAPPIVTPVLPHALGELVTHPVALTTNVRVRNAHEIAPGARPAIIAVRDPFLPAWGTPGCVEQLAYVRVFIPPVPLREVEVSPRLTEIKLDYGKWEIEIRSRHGVIEVEYDD